VGRDVAQTVGDIVAEGDLVDLKFLNGLSCHSNRVIIVAPVVYV